MIFAFLLKTPFYDDIMKGRYSGGLYNGYVGFSGYLPSSYQSGGSGELDDLINVHGGITFDRYVDLSVSWVSGKIPVADSKIPEKGIYRIVGFDTLHYNDTKDIWNLETVKLETKNLMIQIAEILAGNELKKLQGYG